MDDGSCIDESRFSEQLRSLHDISLELATQPDLDSLTRLAVVWGLGHLGFDRLSLWFIESGAPDWNRGTWGTDEHGALRDERAARVPRDPVIAPPEFYEGKVPVLHFRGQPCYDEKRRVVGYGDKALAPLWDGKLIIGELSADNLPSQRPIGVQDLEVLVLYARIIAHLYSLLRTRIDLVRMGEDRSTLLKELKHRTRNNLNVITGLVTLEAFQTENPETRDRLEGLRDRIDALGALYNLLDHEADGRALRLDEYLATVARRLMTAHGADARGIGLVLDLAPVTVDDSRAGSLGIALNELMTDCLKYAFRDLRPGTLSVRLAAGAGEAVLEVRDDGPGLPPGLDLHRSTGLGLGLVTAIAGQSGGEFTGASDGGAVFTLRFPSSP